jgi:hypothetical protein
MAGTPPWVGDARSELVTLVESGVLSPSGRAIDLGCNPWLGQAIIG